MWAVTLLLFYAAFTYASYLRAVLDNRSRYLDLLQDGAVSSNPMTTSFPRKSSSSWAVSFLRPVWGSHPSFYAPGPGMREEFPQHEAVSRSPTPGSPYLWNSPYKYFLQNAYYLNHAFHFMEVKLDGKLAFVTASSRGIGFGAAKVMAASGADVILLSRNEENLKAAKKELEKSGSDVSYIVADLSKRDDLERIETDGIDIFFFSTGGPRSGYFTELEMHDWENAANILLYPAVYLTKKVLPGMIEKKWGRIIYSTSVAIKEPISNIALSNVVRITMAGLVKTLSKEVGKHGITVNGIMPGMIETERMKKLAEDRAKREEISIEEAMGKYAEPIPAGRLGMPEEIGYLAAFLSSEQASYINGAMIPVDGGRLNSVF